MGFDVKRTSGRFAARPGRYLATASRADDADRLEPVTIR